MAPSQQSDTQHLPDAAPRLSFTGAAITETGTRCILLKQEVELDIAGVQASQFTILQKYISKIHSMLVFLSSVHFFSVKETKNSIHTRYKY